MLGQVRASSYFIEPLQALSRWQHQISFETQASRFAWPVGSTDHDGPA
jgi:hypothetical protein